MFPPSVFALTAMMLSFGPFYLVTTIEARAVKIRPPAMVLPLGLVLLPVALVVLPAAGTIVLPVPPAVLPLLVSVVPAGMVMIIVEMAVMMLRMLVMTVMFGVMPLVIVAVPVVLVLIAFVVPPMSVLIVVPLHVAVMAFTGVVTMMTFPVPVPTVIGHGRQWQREHRATKKHCKQPEFRQAILLVRMAHGS